MQCEDCRGVGAGWRDAQGAWVPFGKLQAVVTWAPCPSCTGGIASCCDGMTGGHGDVTNAPARFDAT
jgi:hypothetical protein